ncbi:MAG: hypothetical protein J6I73_05260 [Treponema sp.]|nr:hypothetical protein [Treponema sp.]
MKKKLTIFCALSFAAAVTFSQTVAVLGFESDNFMLEKRTGTMSDLLTDELVGMEHITVLERKQIDKVLEEMDFQMAGYTDAATVKAIGSMLNADTVITGSVALFGNELKVTARTIEVETAKILSSAKMTCSTWNDFTRQLPKFAQECVKKIPVPKINNFAGTWEGNIDGGADFYEITFNNKNKCTVEMTTLNNFGDEVLMKGSGSYSSDGRILRIDARLRTDMGVAKQLSWRSVYKFNEDNTSFNILVKDESGRQVRVNFAKTSE